MRILVVEDEPRIAADISEGLERAGYVAEIVGDGEAAWFRAETETYDAMVLDLGLPRLDRLGVLRRLRGADVALPVLILTARDGWRERVEGIDAGADDYLVKPFRMEELVARLRAILRRTAGHASPSCGPARSNSTPAPARSRWQAARPTSPRSNTACSPSCSTARGRSWRRASCSTISTAATATARPTRWRPC